jgi:hypothetical protein
MGVNLTKPVCVLLLAMTVAAMLSGHVLAAPPPWEEDSALGRLYRDADGGFTLLYAPRVSTRFQTSRSFGEAAGYSDVMDGSYPGELVTVGWIGDTFDFRYTFQRDMVEINRLADLNQTPDVADDDPTVLDAERINHIISINKLARVGFLRLFVNFGWGLSFGHIDFRQRTPSGIEVRNRKSFRNLLLIYEPVVDLFTSENLGFSVSLSYAGHFPMLYGNDFSARTHGAGLLLVATWSP